MSDTLPLFVDSSGCFREFGTDDVIPTQNLNVSSLADPAQVSVTPAVGDQIQWDGTHWISTPTLPQILRTASLRP